MAKFRSAFTLIELMVVVAIIAILSTMGVANFSTAIKRSRNAVRQNDVMAVSKGLETCYDVMKANYLSTSDGKRCGDSGGDRYTSEPPNAAEGVFKVDDPAGCTNRCLSQNIVPNVKNFPYSAIIGNVDGVQKYIVCAQLEQVGNWESIGNSSKDLADNPANIQNNMKLLAEKDTSIACESRPGPADKCYFCVAAQQ